MHTYYASHNDSLPPAFLPGPDGKPAHSWRVLLEISHPEVFKEYRFDEPWNGPNNRKLESRVPRFYSCPADPDGEAKFQTNYFVVVGPGTPFPGARATRFTDFTRPLGETILVVEAVGQGVHWMEPRDLSFDDMSFALNDPGAPSISSFHRRGWVNARMADGTPANLNALAPDKLRSMLLIRPEER